MGFLPMGAPIPWWEDANRKVHADVPSLLEDHWIQRFNMKCVGMWIAKTIMTPENHVIQHESQWTLIGKKHCGSRIIF